MKYWIFDSNYKCEFLRFLVSVMSWDSYIDNLVAYCRDGSGDVHCDKACIIGIDGGAKWTTDGHSKVVN